MNIHRLYYPVLTLGPGRRLGIWTRGCPRRCAGCMSQDMQEPRPDHEIPMPLLQSAAQRILHTAPVDGITVSGGEPFAQADELTELLAFLRPQTGDILVYTGFTFEELSADPSMSAAADLADVLVCGPYIEKLNDGRALRGSSNQEIWFRNGAFRKRYEQVLNAERSIQVGSGSNSVFTIGILG